MQVSKSAYMPKLLIMKFVFKKVALVSVYFDSKLPKDQMFYGFQGQITT